MTASLTLSHVSKEHDGRPILSDCTLALSEGIHTAILGRSGSGKSTALRLFAGLELPTAGEVLVDGIVASRPERRLVPPHRRGIAMVFQDLGLWPALTAVENVLVGMAGREWRTSAGRVRAIAALSLCRVEGLAQRRPGSLSGGEQQRVALARALAAEPRFLFLDEPFSGLDLCTKRELLDDIAALATARGMTLVLVTHDPAEALALCKRAAVIDGGRVVEDGSWEALMREPRSEILRALRS